MLEVCRLAHWPMLLEESGTAHWKSVHLEQVTRLDPRPASDPVADGEVEGRLRKIGQNGRAAHIERDIGCDLRNAATRGSSQRVATVGTVVTVTVVSPPSATISSMVSRMRSKAALTPLKSR